MELGLATLFILGFIIYMAYATGLMKITQTSTERLVNMTDRKLADMDQKSVDKHELSMGKLEEALSDGKNRCSEKDLIKARKAMRKAKEKEASAE